MKALIDGILGKKIKGVRVVPLVAKIVLIFTVFLLLSNIASNYINLVMNRGELVKLMKQLLVKELKDSYVFASNQFELFTYSGDTQGSLEAIEQYALNGMTNEKAILLGVAPDGTIRFMGSKLDRINTFSDTEVLATMQKDMEAGKQEGLVEFNFAGERYFGAYKFQPKWNTFMIRAEQQNDFYQASDRNFRNILLLIIALTVLCVAAGVFVLRFLLRFVSYFTNSIMQMQQSQKIALIDISASPNDEISFLGAAFNSLSSTIDNLMGIFKKFVARDTALKAYREREIRLEGSKRDLAILFTDIKSFTYMTETLGTDIIKLLNLHYDKSIRYIHEHNGDIGSIIGDALLAVFGLTSSIGENKSIQAVRSAYHIQEVAAELRTEMTRRKEDLTRRRGGLTPDEEKVYNAVMLEVGVGIDGGEVFYGTIGSYERMVNTVIGDNVNSSSRLEGLTRVYHIPVIVSEYIRDEILRDTDEYVFIEIDQVQVKGKTIGKRIYWPVEKDMDQRTRLDIEFFSKGLEAYYGGAWKEAYEFFMKCTLPLAEVFRERTSSGKAPKDWNGIWTMKSK